MSDFKAVSVLMPNGRFLISVERVEDGQNIISRFKVREFKSETVGLKAARKYMIKHDL